MNTADFICSSPRPVLSIITVCYNARETISDTLASVASQTIGGKIEHLVIDGASTDGTVDLVRAQMSGITVLVSEPDEGTYDAMNKGISLAKGEVIGFLNADDFYTGPNILEQVATAFKDPDLAACYADLDYVDRTHPDRVVRRWISSAFRPGLFARGWSPPHPTFFVRRSVYQRFGRFDLSYPRAADVELMMRLLEIGRVKSIYLPGVWIKMRMGGASNASLSHVFLQNREILRAAFSHGYRINPAYFVIAKLWNRAGQYFKARL